MTDLTKLLLALLLTVSLALSGCANESSSPDADGQAEQGDHDGHDHGAEGDEDHGDRGADHELDSATIAGTTLRISLNGEIVPSTTAHLEIERIDGPEPAAIRVWIGDEAGAGALKSKATGSGGDYHADVEVPAEISLPITLWIEVEAADGARESGSVSIN